MGQVCGGVFLTVSNSNRSHRYALIAFLASLFAICFAAWLSNEQPTGKPFEKPLAEFHSQSAHSNNNYYQPNEGTDSKSIWDDSAAQWLMAILSVIATIISGVGIKLLLDNLRVTRAAVESTNETAKIAAETLNHNRQIASEQLRPYVVYVSALTEPFFAKDYANEGLLIHQCKFFNCGQTPGIITGISCTIQAPKNGTWAKVQASYKPIRILVGPNQSEVINIDGVQRQADGRFSNSALGILIWYESIKNEQFEESFWLYCDGSTVRQDQPLFGFELYRPDQKQG